MNQWYTKAELLARGWTQGAIDLFLGSPDRERLNPACPQGPKGKLYEVARTLNAESSQEFKRWYVARQARREAQARQARRRHEARNESRNRLDSA